MAVEGSVRLVAKIAADAELRQIFHRTDAPSQAILAIRATLERCAGPAGGEFVPYLFLSVAALAIAAFASLKFSLSLLTCLALVTAVVKITAGKVMGPVSVGAAARAVAWSSLLPALVMLVLLLGSKGTVQVEGFAAILIVFVLFASFVLGFKFSLGTGFGTSATIAVVSTLIASGLLFLLKPLLF